MHTNRNTHLTPHEMLMGRPMPVPYCRGPYKGLCLEQLQLELQSYMIKLIAYIKLSIYRKQEKSPVRKQCRNVRLFQETKYI